ncbi:unnamed protein product [Polarella glacialis]|uniref:C3H1-type domain-containing protein n=1 Tax=Polarella glacialis TaxID=89957 RepID=A0A813H192_POLGL|nr:unnamed protein product [Polarella glacialis]CAE8723294.1 unnamed protein product [Polarella glacialis]
MADMPLKYCYRSTFIEVIDPLQQVHVRTRSQSVPANRAAPACDDLERSSYVASLGHRAEQLAVLSRRCSETVMASVCKDALAPYQDAETWSTASPTSVPSTGMSPCDSSFLPSRLSSTSSLNYLAETEIVPVPVPVPAARLPNPGSMAHPELCHRPCIYFAAGNCANGSACGYCHLPHEQRPPHLDRRQREMLRSLSEAERLALLLPELRCRAEVTGMAAAAGEIFALLEEKAAACAATWPTGRAAGSRVSRAAASPHHPMSKLAFALKRMPFSTVLGMVLRCASAGENTQHNLVISASPTEQRLLDAVDRMRARLCPQAIVYA